VTSRSDVFGRKKDAAKISARNEIAAGANELSVATMKDAVEILDAKQAEAKYKEIVRQDGFAAAHAWLAKGRADGSISENFLQH
jgi:hypothetical protein